MGKRSILVVFGDELPKEDLSQYGTVLSGAELQKFIELGSIYEASAFTEKLSHTRLQDGTRLVKSFTYEGFELWWLYYSSLFTYFGLPYAQYKKLLTYLKNFHSVTFYKPPFKSLFSYYLEAYGSTINILREPVFKTSASLPFGILLQIFITILCIPILMVRKRRMMVFIGDKFEKSQDYDARMKFVYQELRQRKIPFVEFIRSLESWKKVLQHVFIRKRPVIYSEAVAFLGKFLAVFSDKPRFSASRQDPEGKFQFLVATHYLKTVYDDIWAIRIMKWILHTIGVRAGLFTAALDRNFHAVLGCKLNNIPTVGILHGVASRYYNVYDFLPGFDGEKSLTLDKYGVWSEWWKEYYIKNGKAYRPEQLYVSGPMRPLEKLANDQRPTINDQEPIKVLFVSEQPALPREVMPYLETLLDRSDIKLSITFRQYRDGFKDWLLEHRPDFLKRDDIKIVESGLQEAIGVNDVVVGAHSTVVLEGLFKLKVPIFFNTVKWGDYFDLKDYDKEHSFFAENPDEFIQKIKSVRTVSVDTLKDLQERYFGDPYKNGSKWVVDKLEELLL
ncbi:MAG: hypothetical protein A3C70_01550 [Candidatus Zambryskibacteria bacterium RIFCSPHIGHO2_02_FULL_43_14]|uniref:Uncharacterized protein n=1 Tax=Candidatus Zambryskibacteria bacterium RIFCSPHIGHO2_02_FULL_43_14 TaxID=1802748 RepID=A0A1G2TG84_9BACT|nr:MAG: hypothetical protein A2829_03445 [Candidatus Zambryskibacteria bacterium RIFCSPHIGHO2_01_FULL_43_60]OHA96192.1 MAG: hypothetical protein A3C70_01550 [Candidatus Zambryskibacteria bacterium RIFCSPHIGHO2_02_FULL_43_14]OHB03843.1 MAG: hypothetical protein A3B03_03550 [Candidatus Zambryskibacteria bacterium RIFCSPLOWO2_01_FULL_42_41]